MRLIVVTIFVLSMQLFTVKVAAQKIVRCQIKVHNCKLRFY